MPKYKPFVYLATLRRTGSKMLARTLSLPPHAFIFREPGLPRGNLNLGRAEARFLRTLGINIDAIQERIAAAHKRDRVTVFRDEILPELNQHIDQIGIKEIRNRRCERILEAFPDARVVVTARDPRDIYLSLLSKESRNPNVRSRGAADPDELIEYIRREFVEQRTLINEFRAMAVRYEDLCLKPALLDDIRRFVESEVPGQGILESSAETTHRAGSRETAAALEELGTSRDSQKHGGKISTIAVARWASVTDPDTQAACNRIFDSLPEYTEFWNYRKNEPVGLTDDSSTTVDTFANASEQTSDAH